MINEKLEKKLLGEIVTGDFRAAELFKEAGIDFCCGGKNTLEEACKKGNFVKGMVEGIKRYKKGDQGAITETFQNMHGYVTFNVQIKNSQFDSGNRCPYYFIDLLNKKAA